MLAKVIFMVKYSVKLCCCILCGDVAACREMACVLFVVQITVCTTNSTHAVSRHAATSPHNIQRLNFTECFNRSVTLTRLCINSLRMVEDRNM
jgi:hypothetical protein